VYLPRFKKDVPHKNMPDTIAHSQTHTEIYHANIFVSLEDINQMPNATRNDILKVLREIGEDLQDGTFPINKLITRD